MVLQLELNRATSADATTSITICFDVFFMMVYGVILIESEEAEALQLYSAGRALGKLHDPLIISCLG